MKRLVVFCGSSDGSHEAYQTGAAELGRELARRDIALVYGGASVGLMNTVANEVLKSDGEVIGVIPKMLEEREITHPNLTELFVVESMHELKGENGGSCRWIHCPSWWPWYTGRIHGSVHMGTVGPASETMWPVEYPPLL